MIERIGNYKVERELGQGGFGKVYLAFDQYSEVLVAIKKIRVEGDADLLRRFHQEIRTTASLRHKNIVTIYASGEDAGDPYLVMEYLEGRTLKQVIEERLPLTLLDKVQIMKQAAEGFAYAHSKGVVHRDVKPENIMLLPDGSVKIMDFGIALAPNRLTDFTQTGGIIGTPPYLAPEQLEGAKANEQTDIFSYGDAFYEILTGVHPFAQYKNDWRSLQVAILSYEPTAVGQLTPGCPEALETLVHRTLAKEPQFRYRSFREIRDDCEAIIADLEHEAASAILREIPALMQSGDLKTALARINAAFQLDPRNREIRRLRDEINLQLNRAEVSHQVEELLAEAEKQSREGRHFEALRALEMATRLDPANLTAVSKLESAKLRVDAQNRSNRLVEKARQDQQRGLLAEAHELLKEALNLNPENTQAKVLDQKILDTIESRRLEQQRQQVIREVREHLNAKRLTQAKALLDDLDREQPGTAEASDLREEILAEEEAEAQRIRAEKFNLALAKTRELMQAGDLERAQLGLEHLTTHYSSEPGSAEVLAGLRARLTSLFDAREIGQFQQKARILLRDKSLPAAIALLDRGLAKFPDDSGLQRLKRTADDLYRSQQRAEDLARVLTQATEKRAAGNLPGALEVLTNGRQKLGEELALVNFAHEVEMEIEQQRYAAELDSLLKSARELMASGNHAEVIRLLESAGEFRGDAEIHALLDSARIAAAIQEEKRFVGEILAGVERPESERAWPEALSRVERGLAIYPHNPALVQAADRLRDRIGEEQRRGLIEKHRTRIRAELAGGSWRRAEAALRAAEADFPGETSFDDLAQQINAGRYEEGWQSLQERIKGNLATNDVSRAEQSLADEGTRTVYAADPRWQPLQQEVAQRRSYEDALTEADRRRNQGHLSEAEELLTEIINRGAPDKRAFQMRGAIQHQKSESLRQQEIARVAQEIKDQLRRDDLAPAEAALATARARYPGEDAWSELQDLLDDRQRSARQTADLAGAKDRVLRALAASDVRLARDAIADGRKRFPRDGSWASLEAEAQALEAAIERRAQVAAIAGSIRGRLAAGTRQEDLEAAAAELEAARPKHPGEELWDTLAQEIHSRQALLQNRADAAQFVGSCLKLGQLEQAESSLAEARSQFPDESFWAPYALEISDLRQKQERSSELKRIAGNVHGFVDRGDLAAAKAELGRGQVKYPREPFWAELQALIGEREAALARESSIAAAVENLREGLDRQIAEVLASEADPLAGVYPIAKVWDLLQSGAATLSRAQEAYPREGIWAALEKELAERRDRVESQIAQAISSCSTSSALDRNAAQLSAARARYRDDPLGPVLQSLLDERRKTIELSSIADLARQVRDSLALDDLTTAAQRLYVAQQRHPGAPVWIELQGQIEERRAEVTQRQELDELERWLREQLSHAAQARSIEAQWDAFQQAQTALSGARSRYPNDPRAAALESKFGSARAAWMENLAREIRQVLQADPSKERLATYARELGAVLARDPKTPLWARLKSEAESAEALLRRRAEVAAAGERIRESLRAGTCAQADAELSAARESYPREPLWPVIESELQALRSAVEQACQRAHGLLAEDRPDEAVTALEGRFAREPFAAELLARARSALEEQRRRKQRDGVKDRLVELERQVRSETALRRRKTLDRQAQELAAHYSVDAEIAAIAARIHELVETTPRKPLPWKPVGIATAAAMAVFAMIYFRPSTPPPPPPPANVAVEVRTDPEGAEVHIGDLTCVTPKCQLDLKPGPYRIEARLKDYETGQQTASVDATHRLVELTLKPVVKTVENNPVESGSLTVHTEIADVLVFVDGTPRDRTGQNGSLTLTLEAKAHDVRAERSGYQTTATRRVDISPGAPAAITFRMAPLNAKLELMGARENVEMLLDNVSIGRTDGKPVYQFLTAIVPGRHLLAVKPGALVGQNPGEAGLTQEFGHGQTVRVTWKAPPSTGGSTGGAVSGGTGRGSVVVPKGPTAEELDEREWEKARASEDPAQVRRYRNHPKYGKEAEMILERLVWSGVSIDSVNSLRGYLQEFPNGAHGEQAKRQIADLVWRAVDHNQPEQLRRFIEENHANPHVPEAEMLLNGLTAAESARRKQVLDLLTSLNAAFQRKRDSEVKEIWRGNSNRAALQSMKIAGQKISLELVNFVSIQGDIATLRCLLRTSLPAPREQPATVTFRYSGGFWRIEDFKTDQ